MKESDSSSIRMRTLTLEALFTDAPVRKNTHGSFIRTTNKKLLGSHAVRTETAAACGDEVQDAESVIAKVSFQRHSAELVEQSSKRWFPVATHINRRVGEPPTSSARCN